MKQEDARRIVDSLKGSYALRKEEYEAITTLLEPKETVIVEEAYPDSDDDNIYGCPNCGCDYIYKKFCPECGQPLIEE